MPDGGEAITLRILDGIGAVAAADWDACAGPDNPFVRHAFLKALEDSGSATAATGWEPVHLGAFDAGGRLVGAVPLYAKSHSYGEYVFDHAWANAYERAGGRYYPKLQAAVPFTPVTGPRLLCRPDAGPAVAKTLVGGMEEAMRAYGLSSAHVTFPHEHEAERLEQAGWLRRTGVQYHWDNRGYARFDDFLDALASRKRKAIRKERKEVADSGVELLTLTGDDLKAEHWDAFHRFYMDTTDRKWGGGYLKRSFFHQLGDTMADAVVLVMCRDGGEWVAGALNLMGGGVLYGRNWGSDGRYRMLHFEACYYRAIDFAIERGLARVEAGAQGEHKIQRGYLPVRTHSAHRVRDPGFAKALAAHLDQERRMMEEEIAALAAASPYRQENGGGTEK
ncbi:putative N-acyltransferase [Azospirillum fermentarium]|uniref:GNAT family N-acetyltransferase n=1 Tax=Azospirillum fermentarium TaxID=1233114 RepID=UPI002225CEF5|nr:GNAT family N-acetyltransferase [Azospirillum fermentarium]MCW2244934.1 putative N-acyltransferase [Azospirillum fermentarium]